MKKTYDLHVDQFIPLVSPAELKAAVAISETAAETVTKSRRTIQDILSHRDSRLLVIAGPCSIHDPAAALEYAGRLAKLSGTVSSTMFLVMRVYFEKPRTTVGWKGLINDPHMDDTCDVPQGLTMARKLLLKITELGVPTATEMLDPIIPQYISGLVSWAAVGARTTESQTHREMASGLSMPVGFKNGTDGGLTTAINAITASTSPQNFVGIDPEGRTCIVKTTGNPYAHLVLRGGSRPNYDSVSIREAVAMLGDKGLPQSVIIDCSHANSNKDYQQQAIVWEDVINQRLSGNPSISGLMLESNLNPGNQKITEPVDRMEYGVSITDPCISWQTTEELILSAHERLANR